MFPQPNVPLNEASNNGATALISNLLAPCINQTSVFVSKGIQNNSLVSENAYQERYSYLKWNLLKARGHVAGDVMLRAPAGCCRFP